MQSKASDVGTLVNVGVICYLKQLLDTGFFHAGGCIHTLTHSMSCSVLVWVISTDDALMSSLVDSIIMLYHPVLACKSSAAKCRHGLVPLYQQVIGGGRIHLLLMCESKC